MIVNTETAPLFWYIYRPHTSRRTDPGGFSVALYGDNILVCRKFNALQQEIECDHFQLPPEVVGSYMQLLQNQSGWMGKVPLSIKTNGAARYSCMFGFAGQPMFYCEEINTLVQAPFNSVRGRFARRLRLMLEEVSELLFDCGIGLTVEDCVWDYVRIKPLETLEQEAAQASPVPPSPQMPPVEENAQDEPWQA